MQDAMPSQGGFPRVSGKAWTCLCFVPGPTSPCYRGDPGYSSLVTWALWFSDLGSCQDKQVGGGNSHYPWGQAAAPAGGLQVVFLNLVHWIQLSPISGMQSSTVEAIHRDSTLKN